MHMFKLTSFPIEQVIDLDAFERKLGTWFAAVDYPVRLLACSRPFEMRQPIQTIAREERDLFRLYHTTRPLVQAVLACQRGETGAQADPWHQFRQMDVADQVLLTRVVGDPAVIAAALEAEHHHGDSAVARWEIIVEVILTLTWPLPWAREQIRFYEELQQRHIRSATYLLLAWPPADVSADTVRATLRHAFGREVQVIDQLPSVIAGAYTVDEQRARLRPEQAGLPWLTVLQAYDSRGVYDATVLHRVLDADFDVAIAIDIQTLARNRAMREAELAYSAARALLRDGTIKDMRGERVLADAERVMHAIPHGEGFHEVHIAMLVSGHTPEQLETNAAEMTAMLGSTLRLTRVAGAQRALMNLWSTLPSRKIEAPMRRRAMLSHGVGCYAGMLGYHRSSRTDGLLWGLDAIRRAPLFFDPFQGNQAAHMVILGKTGYGKTFFLNVMTIRAAALAGHRVIWIDAFENGYRLARAIGPGARCYPIGLERTLNLLDVVYEDTGDGAWIRTQVQHVISQMALLLGATGMGASGKKQLLPRQFSTSERGVLDRALSDLYATVDPAGTLDTMPRLSDLITALEELDELEASALAYELRMLLFGRSKARQNGHADGTIGERTGMGQSFDGATDVDWTMSHDVTCFDLSQVQRGAEHLLPFYYAQIIGAVYRYMRDPRRDRSRKTLVIIDEFGIAAQVEAVAQLAATMCKVARKFGIAMVTVDQNPSTFLGNPSGKAIIENAVGRVMFHLDDVPAHEMGAAISDLAPAHIDYLVQAQKGECLAVFGNDVYVMHVEPNPKELRALSGS